MKMINSLGSAMLAVSLAAIPVAFAADPPKMAQMDKMNKMDMNHDMEAFMKSCDMDHDGMMSKAEMMKHMEKMFDQMDTMKTGKLDSKQTREFLKKLTAQSGA